ncbi:MAG TPA: DinB family protein [Burkholderiales bacterium]|nr:DinB family protein [Burkholderiales bacterium]
MLARYNAWANEVMFKAVAALPAGEAEKPRPSVFKNMVHTLNHNYVIDRIFQAHLEGRAHGYNARNTAEHPPLAELWRAQQEIDRWYIRWSDVIPESSLNEQIKFTYIGGGEGLMSRREILQHLVVHTSYHRGFVAQMMFDIPVRPPITDLTVYLRDVHGDGPHFSR